MTESEADEEARRLNLELGQGGEAYSFWAPVQSADGEWSVEKRESRPSWWRRIWDAFLNTPTL